MIKNYKPLSFLFFFCCIIPMLSGAGSIVQGQTYNQQKDFLNANKVWAFGAHAGLDFNFNPPQAFESASNSFGSCASLASPTTGQLLFYSQGNSCFNRNHRPMPNGSNLLGNPFNMGLAVDGGTRQGVCIVPSLEKPGQYYLFSLGDIMSNTGKLYYSIVDTAMENGYGDIVAGKKNLLLDDQLSESMIAVPGNNCDIWLLVHDRTKAQFKAYHITYSGINKIPVLSDVGVAGRYAKGELTVSPDRKTLALGQTSASILPANTVTGLQLFHFNVETGVVSDPINVFKRDVFSVAFSPNGQLLYAQLVDTLGASIRQYGISSYLPATILSTEYIVDTFPINTANALRHYDGKIYITRASQSYLSLIKNPNVKGLGCGYQIKGVDLLSTTKSHWGLSAETVMPIPRDTISTTVLDTMICSNTASQSIAPIQLKSRKLTGLYIWDNGVTDSVRTITKRGRYWLFYKGDCNSYRDSFIVGGSDFNLDLGADTLLCDADSFKLSPSVPSNSTFLWQDNDTSTSFIARTSGAYRLSVTSGGCKQTDSIQITFPALKQNLGKDTIQCSDIPIALNLYARVPNIPGTETLWSTGENTPSIVVKDTGSYWVEVSTQYCKDADTIRVSKQVCNCRMAVPTAFSPNGDGHNDIFLPVIEAGCMVNQYILSIYNRWGQRIYSNSSFLRGWDGTYNGAPADLGTYFYSVQFIGGIYQQDYYQKGDFILIR